MGKNINDQSLIIILSYVVNTYWETKEVPRIILGDQLLGSFLKWTFKFGIMTALLCRCKTEEIKWSAKGHTAIECQSQNFNPDVCQFKGLVHTCVYVCGCDHLLKENA